MAHHDLIVHPLVLRCVRVAAVTDLTPRMRRVTLTGEQLGAFTQDGIARPPFVSPGFDDHVKLIFAADGNIAAALPVQLAHGIEWGPSEARQGRDYTPTRFDPVTRELDLDFVMHGDGPAASWARDARPGSELWFAGPKSSTIVPTDADWVLLAGDETALPAIARFLAERPVAAPARVVITITDAAAQQQLSIRDADRIEWVVADAADERALAAAIDRVPPLPGTPYIWAAAESRALLPVRRIARALGAPKSHVNITGYWHHHQEEAASAGAATPALPEPPVLWFAVRAALRLGVLDALAAGPLPLGALAERVSAQSPTALMPLLGCLTQAGVLREAGGGRYALDRLGEELGEDEHAQEDYSGVEAAQVLALAALPEAITEGGSAWQHTHGASLLASAQAEPAYFEELIEQAGSLPHVLTGLGKDPVWAGAERITVTGPGAIQLAAVAESTAGRILTVYEAAGPLAALRVAAGERDWAFSATQPQEQDLVVTALALGIRSDAEVVVLLRMLRDVAPRALLVERLTPDGLSEAAGATHALRDYAAVGVPARGPEQVLQLAETAGWRVGSRAKLGWGIERVELSRTARHS